MGVKGLSSWARSRAAYTAVTLSCAAGATEPTGGAATPRRAKTGPKAGAASPPAAGAAGGDAADEHKEQQETAGVLLAVDGAAFVYFLLSEDGPAGPAGDPSVVTAACGMPYPRLAAAAARWVTELTAAGAALVFVFDGLPPPDKSSTAATRYLDRAQEASAAESRLAHDAHPSLSKTVPQLATMAVVDKLKSLTNVRVLRAYREADPMLMHVAIKYKAAAVLSNDSDFMIKGPGLCLFPDVSASAADRSISMRLYSPQKLAAILRVPIADLPLVAALVGNDFIDADASDKVHGVLQQHMRRQQRGSRVLPIESAAAFARLAPADRHMNQTLQAAVMTAAAMYNSTTSSVEVPDWGLNEAEYAAFRKYQNGLPLRMLIDRMDVQPTIVQPPAWPPIWRRCAALLHTVYCAVGVKAGKTSWEVEQFFAEGDKLKSNVVHAALPPHGAPSSWKQWIGIVEESDPLLSSDLEPVLVVSCGLLRIANAMFVPHCEIVTHDGHTGIPHTPALVWDGAQPHPEGCRLAFLALVACAVLPVQHRKTFQQSRRGSWTHPLWVVASGVQYAYQRVHELLRLIGAYDTEGFVLPSVTQLFDGHLAHSVCATIFAQRSSLQGSAAMDAFDTLCKSFLVTGAPALSILPSRVLSLVLWNTTLAEFVAGSLSECALPCFIPMTPDSSDHK